jgi:hypothetical protein
MVLSPNVKLDTHQKQIAWLVFSALSQAKAREALTRGNVFSMLLRSYDEHTSAGEPLYHRGRGIYHYWFSEAAYKKHLANVPIKELHGEHMIPLKCVKERLLKEGRTYEAVLEILRQNKVVIITDDEANYLNGSPKRKSVEPLKHLNCLGLGSSMPDEKDPKSRLKAAGIRIAKATINNKL